MDFNRKCPQLLRQRCRGAQLRFSHSGTVGLSGLPMEPCSPGSPVTPLRSFRTGKSYLAEMCSARALPWFGHLCNLCVSHWKPYKNCSKRCVHTIYVQLTTLALSLSLAYSMKLDWYDVVILWTCACISKSLVHTYLLAFCFFGRVQVKALHVCCQQPRNTCTMPLLSMLQYGSWLSCGQWSRVAKARGLWSWKVWSQAMSLKPLASFAGGECASSCHSHDDQRLSKPLCLLRSCDVLGQYWGNLDRTSAGWFLQPRQHRISSCASSGGRNSGFWCAGSHLFPIAWNRRKRYQGFSAGAAGDSFVRGSCPTNHCCCCSRSSVATLGPESRMVTSRSVTSCFDSGCREPKLDDRNFHRSPDHLPNNARSRAANAGSCACVHCPDTAHNYLLHFSCQTTPQLCWERDPSWQQRAYEASTPQPLLFVLPGCERIVFDRLNGRTSWFTFYAWRSPGRHRLSHWSANESWQPFELCSDCIWGRILFVKIAKYDQIDVQFVMFFFPPFNFDEICVC